MTYRSRLARTPIALDQSSIMPASTLMLAAIGFGVSRDFGVFLLSIIMIPVLLLVTAVWIGAALIAGGGRRRSVGMAVAIALLSFAAYPLAQLERDPVRFAGWGLTHIPLSRFTPRDGVLTDWDSWGLAGMGNDSYLVVDTSDASGSLASAERWRHRLGLKCEIVDSRRMASRLFIVTTANCPFDFDGRHWS